MTMSDLSVMMTVMTWMRRWICLISCISISVAGTSFAGPPVKTEILYETSIFTDGDALFVDVHRGQRVCRFIVDTGAPITLIDSNAFKSLFRDQVPTVTNGSVGGVSIRIFINPKDLYVGGKLLIASTHLGVFNFAPLSAGLGTQIDGVLGCDFLKNYIVKLDFDHKRLAIGSDIPKPRSLPREFSRSSHGLPRIRIALPNASGVAGDPHQYVVDTGAIGPIEVMLNTERFQEAVKNGILTVEGKVPGAGLAGANSSCKGLIRGFDLWLDSPCEVRVAENSEPDNLIALQFLLRFNVTLDFPNAKLYVESRQSWSPVDWKDKSGLTLFRYSDKVVVGDVSPQSPAAKSDIREGDVIMSVDSVPASECRLMSLRLKCCEEGKTIKMGMRRGSKQWVAELQLTDYRKPPSKADFE